MQQNFAKQKQKQKKTKNAGRSRRKTFMVDSCIISDLFKTPSATSKQIKNAELNKEAARYTMPGWLNKFGLKPNSVNTYIRIVDWLIDRL